MRRLPVFLCTLLTALALPVATAAPAHAKGATSVTVSGPGIDQVTLGFTRRAGDADVGSLAEDAGLYGIFGDGMFVDRPDLTPAELGPRYTLRWYEGDAFMVVSHVYPFAEGGAWAEVPGGQEMWGEQVRTGWWHGGSVLQEHLESLGATGRAATSTEAAPTSEAAVVPAAPSSSSGFPLMATGAAVLAGLALLLGAAWWGRRRTPGVVPPNG